MAIGSTKQTLPVVPRFERRRSIVLRVEDKGNTSHLTVLKYVFLLLLLELRSTIIKQVAFDSTSYEGRHELRFSIHVRLRNQDRKPIRAETSHQCLRRVIYFRGVWRNSNFKRILPFEWKRRGSDGGGYISGSDTVRYPTSSYLLLSFKCTSHLENEMQPITPLRTRWLLLDRKRERGTFGIPSLAYFVSARNSPNDESSEILFDVTRIPDHRHVRIISAKWIRGFTWEPAIFMELS